jgi:hypothetical protein
MKRRLAVVVQRCHESIVGGSEALAWQYANLLKSHYNVEILTSTALDYRTWASELPTGSEIRDGVTIRRFARGKSIGISSMNGCSPIGARLRCRWK